MLTILLASRAIYSCIPRKRAIQYNNIIIIYTVLCVYYLRAVSDCKQPFFYLQTAGNNVSENAQIHVDNIIAVLVTKRVEYTILFWPLKVLYE